jgi:tetratricopeptide (TPR) repeat protein
VRVNNGATDSQLIRLLAITGGSPEEIEEAINLLIESTKRSGMELPNASIQALYEDINQGLIQSLNFDRAKAVAALAIARYPNESASYGYAAGTARLQEDYTGALALLQRGLSINSNDVMLLSELAQALHHQGENTKAIMIAKELVHDHPELSGMMENILHSP